MEKYYRTTKYGRSNRDLATLTMEGAMSTDGPTKEEGGGLQS